MPLVRKTPKRGFKNVRFADQVAIINIDSLNIFDNNETVTIERLQKTRLVRGEFDVIKVLGNGQLEKEGLIVHAHRFSESARKKIEDKKGKIVLCKD